MNREIKKAWHVCSATFKKYNKPYDGTFDEILVTKRVMCFSPQEALGALMFDMKGKYTQISAWTTQKQVSMDKIKIDHE